MTLANVFKSVWRIGIVFVVGACSVSIDVSDPTDIPEESTPGGTLPASPSTPEDSQTDPSTENDATGADFSWAGRGLTGRLLLLFMSGESDQLVEFSFETGEQNVIYTFPTGSLISAAEFSPDGSEIVLAYSPDDGSPFGYFGIYVMPADGSADPRPILDFRENLESLFFPTWSPDGSYLYYSRIRPGEFGNQTLVERVSYPDGEPELLVEDAFWQRLSPDGSRMAFLSWDIIDNPDVNELYIANPDGSSPTRVITQNGFSLVDAPTFSADSRHLLFSVPEELPTNSLSWLDRLTGVRIARAHNVPSDWWIVPISGGEPKRLTELFTTGLFGEFSPNGTQIASLFVLGLFVMNSDGTDILFIPVGSVPYGTLDWAP